MKSKRAFAIPVSLCVAGVVLFLGASVSQLCAGDLQVATHEYYKERALQIADFTLEKGIADFRNGPATYSFNGTTAANGDDRGNLTVYDNRTGTLPVDSGCPVKVPVGFQYWVASGEARHGSKLLATARLGAMVQWGQPLGSAGAQIRYLAVKPQSFNLRTLFEAVDSSQQVLDDKVICATEARDGTLPAVHEPELVKPVSFHQVLDMHGKVRIPTGVDSNEVVQADLLPNQSLNIDSSGGFFNVPPYSPPTPSRVLGAAEATSSPTLLEPGEYGDVNLAGGTTFRLHGVYHFKNLNLLAGSGDYPRLENDATGATELFIDKVNAQPGMKLKLDNPQSTASAFKINLKPAPADTPSLDIEVNAAKDLNGNFGGIWLIAPKRTVNVSTQSSSVIRGSFTCTALGLNFGTNANPAFVYDTTVDTSRRNQTSDTLNDTNGDTRTDGVEELTDTENSRLEPMIIEKTRI